MNLLKTQILDLPLSRSSKSICPEDVIASSSILPCSCFSTSCKKLGLIKKSLQ